jgi:hypothetical protein
MKRLLEAEKPLLLLKSDDYKPRQIAQVMWKLGGHTDRSLLAG